MERTDAANPDPIADPASCSLTKKRVAYRVQRLTRIFRLSTEDSEDLRQEVWCELLRALQRFKPASGTRHAFTRGVLDKWYMHTARSIRRHRERAQIYQFPEYDGEPFDITDPSSCHVRAADMRMDLEESLAKLPRELRWLAEELKYKPVREIADDAGCHRGTVYRRLGRLRELLGEFFDETA